LVGPNGAGKSNVLTAINIFFREYDDAATDLGRLDREDFHQRNTNEPIRITITFVELSPEAQEDFADYFRQGKLIVSAIASFNDELGQAEVKQYGQRLGMPEFTPFFEAIDKQKVAELKAIYSGLNERFADLPSPGTKENMIVALQQYEANRPENCKLIPSKYQFYGFSKGTNRLAKHVQWVFVPAVKDATSEQVEEKNSALGKLLARTVRSKTNFENTVKNLRTEMQVQYQNLLDENQHVLDSISGALQARLSDWAHPEATLRLQWKQVRYSPFVGQI
jgi:putative ATP-dependent endonuclease of OLD family